MHSPLLSHDVSMISVIFFDVFRPVQISFFKTPFIFLRVQYDQQWNVSLKFIRVQ